MDSAKDELEPVLASLAYAHFGDKLKAQQKCEALQRQSAQEREFSVGTLQAAISRVEAANKMDEERQLRLQQQTTLL